MLLLSLNVLWLEWMCDECTWHHKTFLMQSVYWHLAIKLYCILYCKCMPETAGLDCAKWWNDSQWPEIQEEWFTMTRDPRGMVHNDQRSKRNDSQWPEIQEEWFTMTRDPKWWNDSQWPEIQEEWFTMTRDPKWWNDSQWPEIQNDGMIHNDQRSKSPAVAAHKHRSMSWRNCGTALWREVENAGDMDWRRRLQSKLAVPPRLFC